MSLVVNNLIKYILCRFLNLSFQAFREILFHHRLVFFHDWVFVINSDRDILLRFPFEAAADYLFEAA
jgi:hypothetical protein